MCLAWCQGAWEEQHKRLVKPQRKGPALDISMQGEAALDEGLTSGVGADLDCLANVDLLPGDIKPVPLNESMIVFRQGV